MKTMKKFNFLTFSFHGQSLIEASAGTGKTYIITMLYLRLLLGVHNGYLQALTVKKILLVTFTKIATEELRERIRNSIREFRLACITGYSENIFFSELLSKLNDVSLAYRQLLEAEKNINSAQIFTIHAFCQRVLDMCPIELRSIFQYKILKDEDLIFKKACNDFWRRYFYPLPLELVSIIKEYWRDPISLFEDINPHLYNMEINIKPVIEDKDILKQHNNIINYINYVKNMWNDKRSGLLDLFNALSLNRHIYSKRNLEHWLKNIDYWSNEEMTKNYKIPKELKRFRYSVIVSNINIQNNQKLQCPLFKVIDKLFKKILLLKQLIFSITIYELRKIVKNIKNSSSEISFNDLIYLLYCALCCPDRGKKLAQLICECYPMAIIDEFQDTDFYQYKIFQKLYSLYQSKFGLLLIGDPKQSIYSFRGADIFSYLLARKYVDFHYTLDINWRSSKSMVNAVNTLFQFNSSPPFIFRSIPFIPTNFSKKNEHLSLIVRGKLYPALHFWLPSNKLTLYEYQKLISYQCAYTIFDLLSGAYQHSVWIKNKNKKRLLQESDIVILVRDHNEGRLISSVLERFSINSSYLSNRENIFKTKEANDLLLILQAILAPENDSLLRCALITDIIGYDAKQIDLANRNESDWEKEVKNFTNYYFFWRKHDLQSMLREIIFRRCILEKLICTREGERRLINILHLGEVLQKKLVKLHNDEHSLIYWFNMKITTTCSTPSDDELLRTQLFDHRLIKIVTIHKVKGLEFPLVFLPFIPIVHTIKYPLYHDRKNYQMYLDLNASLENVHLSKEERLSEDLRIFYVAITRAIYYCFIGIGAISFTTDNIKNNSNSDLHRTALGYLVQNGIPGDCKFLMKCLKKLIKYSGGDIVCNFIEENKFHQLLVNNNKLINNNHVLKKNSFFAKSLEVSVNTTYKVTSYTELIRFNELLSYSETSDLKLKNVTNYEKSNEIEEYDFVSYTPHTFPRGNIFGVFLHRIFEKLNFKKKICDEWLLTKLNQSGIDSVWLPILKKWINVVINTPLDNKDLMLSKLSFVNCNSELQFYLSINNLVSAKKFDKICKNYDSISRLSENLKFPNIIGMLRGFIDLVFFWKGKYYLVDYKSNWLGESYGNYVFSSIKNEMVVQNYALQYQIYTLALHRFLRHKLRLYDYEKDFGGVYYLFLRGMDLMHPGYGIYFCRPKKLLINELDQLLSISHTFTQ